MSIDKNIETVVDFTDLINLQYFWKDKETIKKQLNILSLEKLKLIKEINEFEYLIKKNSQISNLF